MGPGSMKRFPEIRVFAGPNGSGKSTVTTPENIISPYLNADELQKRLGVDNHEAAVRVTAWREASIACLVDFTFETVLSTDRNLRLLEQAKEAGYFIRCSFVLTADPALNVKRVETRVRAGGHDVPVDKIISRYYKSLAQIPPLRGICDRLNIYDNTTDQLLRIFKQRGREITLYPNRIWSEAEITELINHGRNRKLTTPLQ